MQQPSKQQRGRKKKNLKWPKAKQFEKRKSRSWKYTNVMKHCNLMDMNDFTKLFKTVTTTDYHCIFNVLLMISINHVIHYYF